MHLVWWEIAEIEVNDFFSHHFIIFSHRVSVFVSNKEQEMFALLMSSISTTGQIDNCWNLSLLPTQ